ncbi:MAG TPA: DUF4232 domain-containing protein, partial [Acidimicrobiales bacterium]|nr:DUF4232 domain-containing protein [Acidimicrobiales bacterium]
PVGVERALVVLTDAAGVCRVTGFAGLQAVEGGRARPLQVVGIDQSSSPRAVALSKGGSAYAAAEWTAGAGCPEVSSFEVAVAGGAASIPAVLEIPGSLGTSAHLCRASVELGPFAATAEATGSPPAAPAASLTACSSRALAGSYTVAGPTGEAGAAGTGAAAAPTTTSGATPTTEDATAVIVNEGSRTCRLEGGLGVALVAGGTALPTVLRHAAAPPDALAVGPGQDVTLTIALGAAAGSGCQSRVATIVVALPGGEGLSLDGPTVLACSGETVSVGGLQAGPAAA